MHDRSLLCRRRQVVLLLLLASRTTRPEIDSRGQSRREATGAPRSLHGLAAAPDPSPLTCGVTLGDACGVFVEDAFPVPVKNSISSCRLNFLHRLHC
jgi:hypothetical protein